METYLCRHGNRERYPNDRYTSELTNKGKHEVHSLAQELKLRFPQLRGSQAIWTSPYRRSRQTAEIVQAELDIEHLCSTAHWAELYPDLSRCDDGSWLTPHQQMLMNPDMPTHNGSSLNQCVQDALEFIRNRHDMGDEHVIISSHGEIIRAVAYWVDPSLRPSDAATFLTTQMHEAGYTVLEYDGLSFAVKTFNQQSELL